MQGLSTLTAGGARRAARRECFGSLCPTAPLRRVWTSRPANPSGQVAAEPVQQPAVAPRPPATATPVRRRSRTRRRPAHDRERRARCRRSWPCESEVCRPQRALEGHERSPVMTPPTAAPVEYRCVMSRQRARLPLARGRARVCPTKTRRSNNVNECCRSLVNSAGLGGVTWQARATTGFGRLYRPRRHHQIGGES